MLDGSYATVTVSGYNYYNYGFRVWIRQANGNKANESLPVMTGGYGNWTEPDDVTTTLESHLKTGDDYNFVYEVKNELGKEFQIKNYIRARKVENFVMTETYIAATGWNTVPVGGSVEMKYNIEDLQTTYTGYDEIFIGCFFKTSDEWWCGGWENMIVNGVKNERHIVTVLPPETEGPWFDGINSWEQL